MGKSRLPKRTLASSVTIQPVTVTPDPHDDLQTLERELVVAAGRGDSDACTRLVKKFFPSILTIAHTYTSTGVDRDELTQEGVVGLLRAAQRFDPSFDVPFWAYASWWVRQAMQRMVAEVSGPFVLSDRTLRKLARLQVARSEHVQQHCGEPTSGDLAKATSFPKEQIESLLGRTQRPRSLNNPVRADENTDSFADLLADPMSEDGYERVVDRLETKHLDDLTESLDDRERTIIAARYGLGGPRQKLRQIAAEVDLSVERVRQIEERALEKMRKAAIEVTL